MKHFLGGFTALLCALLLAGCGSSDDNHSAGGGTPQTAMCPGGTPDSALSSVSGLITYTKQLVGASSETSEPEVTCNAALPTDDSAEPSN